MRAAWSIVALAACMATTGVAFADVVGPPATDCPPGSYGSTSHSGPYCPPALCTTEYEANRCSAAETCEGRQLCIEEIPCGGRPIPDAAPCTLSNVTAECSPSGSCARGTCQMLRVCMPSSGTGGASASGGSANTGGSSTSGGSAATGGAGVTQPTGGQGPATGTGGAGRLGDRELSQDSGCGCRMKDSRGPGVFGLLLVACAVGARRRWRRRW